MARAMSRAGRALAAAVLLSAVPAAAQDSEFFAPPKTGGLEVEALIRHERTRKIFVSPTETTDDDRWRFRLMPRISAGGNRFKVQLGGDFNHGTDKNLDPLENGERPTLLRDNYDSRSVRLDLALAHLQPTNWLQLEGGRFVMPLGVTEMIWDKDLRPQGGTVRLTTGALGDIQSLSAAFLYSQGAHVFDDGKVRLLAGSATARLAAGMNTNLELTGSLLEFNKLNELELMIRRQNTRDADGNLARKFRVFDIVGRVQASGNVPVQLVANMAWNTEADEQNRGLWFALVLGSLKVSRARVEYTFASVDRDVTVAAYASDDFFWATGWAGHRVDIGTRSGSRFTVHAIAQLQRFKDAPRVEERDHWMQRFRAEIRLVP